MTEVNWVAALAQCSLTPVFIRLKAGAEADVRTRTALRQGEAVTFGVTDHGEMFAVYLDDNSGRTKKVTFTRNPHDITVVANDGTPEVKATLTLNNLGECRLLVNGQELEEWQFRKNALGRLFFGAS